MGFENVSAISLPFVLFEPGYQAPNLDIHDCVRLGLKSTPLRTKEVRTKKQK